MRCLAEKDDARIADPPEQWLELSGVDRLKLFTGGRNGLSQRPLCRCDRWAIFRGFRTALLRHPAFLAH